MGDHLTNEVLSFSATLLRINPLELNRRHRITRGDSTPHIGFREAFSGGARTILVRSCWRSVGLENIRCSVPPEATLLQGYAVSHLFGAVFLWGTFNGQYGPVPFPSAIPMPPPVGRLASDRGSSGRDHLDVQHRCLSSEVSQEFGVISSS